MVNTRRYAGPRGLRAMQELTSRIWSPESRWHVGDLAWGRFQHVGREPEWPTMLWHTGGRTPAWGWIELPGHMELVADQARPELVDEVLGWFEETVRDPDRSVVVSSAETHLIEAIERRGYLRADDGPFFVQLSRGLEALPEIRLPAGYVARPVGDEDAPGRVMAHRAAFHPSRVSVESYSAVRDAWPYPGDLDCCVVAPDGSVAAYCLGRGGSIAGSGFGTGPGACTFTPDRQAMRNRDMRGGDLRSEYGQPPELVAVGRRDVRGVREDGDGAFRELDAVAVECHPRHVPQRRQQVEVASSRPRRGSSRPRRSGAETFVRGFGTCGKSHFRSREIYCDHAVEVAIHGSGSAMVRNSTGSVAVHRIQDVSGRR